MMELLLRPFTAIISRLKYGRKFALVSILMFIPLVWLLTLWLTEQQNEIRFIEKEQAGASHINEMLPLILQIQQHRGLVNGFLNGNESAKADIEAKAAEIGETVMAVDRKLGALSFPAALRSWQEMLPHWEELQSKYGTMSAAESFDKHSELVGLLEQHIIRMADESGLSLDKELESYYLMKMLVEQLPVLIENAAVIRGKGNGVLTKSVLDEETKMMLLLEEAKMQSAFEGMNKSLAIVGGMRNHSGGELDKFGEAAAAATDRFRQLLKDEIVQAGTFRMKGDDFFQEGTAAIGVTSELFYQVHGELSRVLSDRAEKLAGERNLMLAATILSIVLVTLFYLAFYRNVMVTVLALKNRLEQMADGDLAGELKLATKDELSQAGAAFNQMLHSLNELMRSSQLVSELTAASSKKLSDIAHESTLAMKQVAESIHAVSEGTEAQSIAAGETSAAMNEMAAGITRVAEAASEVADAAVKAADNARHGEEQLAASVRQMGNIQASSVRSTAVVSHLAQRSEQIGVIVNSVMDIAMQTQLIALNANIEAARAGEHGRGFGVVASEVGKLADQTAASVKSISELLGDIRSLVDDSVAAMEMMKAETDSGLASVSSANERIGSILNEIQIMSGQIQEVSAASEQISAGMEEVSASIAEVAAVSNKTSSEAESMASATEQQLASMEGIFASAEQLSGLAQRLQADLGRFRLSRSD
ncbi:methyl-accepting chemotaxis protein [Paenibacillus sp. N4]|uniref:methyl-accepting chemotaxis protein n=1 Tax=Paenibacillus vietnamensis TaxID=2590547 RepID=UPI001CD167E7|nr:methyl-accepting chemotaxis protein [Paenibacillus vietnamensis]MCA0758505.1 methyl-accepting chemotaxis protein [Paenibacillus vietnamensis]